MKPHRLILLFSALFIISLISFLLFTFPGQAFVGSYFDFLNPKRAEQLRVVMEKKSDNSLLNYLHNGDLQKSSLAASILAERGNKDLFEPILENLKNKSKNIRMDARRILPYLDNERAGAVFMSDLKKWDKTSFDYDDTLLMLSYMKYPPAYPYLIDYAKNDLGNKNASSEMLKRFGDPRVIPVLQEMLNKDPKPDEFETKRIQDAIQTLEKIAADQKPVQTIPSNT